MEDVEQVYRQYVLWESKPLTALSLDPSYPQNLDEFCKKWKCTKQDLGGFEARETFADDVLGLTLAWAKTKTSKLIQEVYKKASDSKNVADLERFLNMIHEFKKKDRENKSMNQYNFFTNGVSEDRYERIIEREADRLKASGAELSS